MAIYLASVNDKQWHKGKCYCTTVGHMPAQYERIECLVPYWYKLGLYSNGWDIVKGHQNKQVSDEQYTRIYKYILGNKQNWPVVKAWLDSLKPDVDSTLLCFCREFDLVDGVLKPKFCHRRLIAQMIEKHRTDIKVVLH